MNSTLLNIAIVLALILVEACFVASEIALVSLREGQVRGMAERGRRSRRRALPGRALGGDPAKGREAIGEEELRGLVAAHESLTTDERGLIDDVFAASEHSVSEVMVSRTEVTFLEASMTVSRASK